MKQEENAMHRKFKILAVAPYESLKEVLLQTAKEYPQLDVTVEVGPIYEGLKKLQKYDLSQFDAVLSRGGTKMEIEKHTTLPVFKIPISYFDLLNIIKLVEHYQGKIAILTYENIANAARVLCDLLHFPYNIFIINEWHNAKEKVLQLKEQGYTLIIGDAVSVIQAERLGLQSILLTSSAASVREAYEHILNVCSYVEPFRTDTSLFHQYCRSQQETIFYFDRRGKLLYGEDSPGEQALQSFCAHQIPALEKEQQLITQKQWQGTLLEIQGNRFLVRQVPYYFFSIKRMTPLVPGKQGTPYLSLFEPSAPHTLLQGLPNILQLLSPGSWKRTLQLVSSGFNCCLIGEAGTDSDSLVHALYEKSSHAEAPLYCINPLLLKEADMRRLCTDSHSPLFLPHASLYFRNLAQLDDGRFQYLLDELSIAAYESTAKLYFSFEGSEKQESLESRCQQLQERFQLHTVLLPTLRNKGDQILNYALLYIQSHNHMKDTHIVGMEPEAITLLCQYDWPQNLKQLQRVLQKAVLSTDAPWITARTIRLALQEEQRSALQFPRSQLDLGQPLHQIIQQVVGKVLQEENNNQTKAARRLGISRTTLWRLMKGK